MYHTIDLHFQNLKHAIGSFLIETDEGPILIETGPFSTFSSLENGLNLLGYKTEDVKHVLLTHIHFDHAGAAWYFSKNGANIYLHPFGVKHMQDPTRLIASATKIYGDNMDTLWGKMEDIKEDRLVSVNHEQVIEIGGKKITALHTPGHAKHHIAWQLEGIIFTGDVGGVKIEDGPVVPPCPPPDISIEYWGKSIAQILEKNPEKIVLTHYGEIDNPSSHFAELHEILRSWSEFIKDCWDAGLSQDDIIYMFMKYTREDFKNKGVSDYGIQQYEAANPSWMSVAGLIRYWNKKNS